MKSQYQTILNHLIDHGPITVIQAAELYRVRSLTKLIHTLKQNDFNIVSEWVTDPMGRRFKRYSLA